MNRKWSLMILMTLCLLALPSCQLAQEDISAEEDTFIGVFLTEDDLYADLDWEAYFNDHPQLFSGGGEIDLLGEDVGAYQGRVYGQLHRESVTLENGVKEERLSCAFPGVEGVVCFLPTSEKGEEGNYWKTWNSDPAVHIKHNAVSVSDAEDEVRVEAEVYIPSGTGERYFSCHPIRETGDGRVYLDPSGNSYGTHADEVGEAIGLTLSEDESVTIGGETKSQKRSVCVNVKVVAPVERLRVLQMDGESRVLERMDFLPGEAPERLTPAAGTAYLILESFRTDDTVDRELLSPKDETMQSYCQREDGYFILQDTELLWTT